MNQDAAATPATTLRLTVNGDAREVAIDERMLLVEALRDALELKGTHIGCLTGDCGACTVQLDGQIVKSCLMLAVQAEGAEIVTIEGIAVDGELTPIQQAFWDEYGFQCGYCLPGMLLATQELLSQNADPSEQEIRDALDGNICRCTGYEFIVQSVKVAAERMRTQSS